jgi:DNA-binding SARP family transcriptional activator
MEIRILGPLEVLDEKGRVSLGGPRQRTVLANLTLRPNQLVSAERLIDEVWGDNSPEARDSSQFLLVVGFLGPPPPRGR